MPDQGTKAIDIETMRRCRLVVQHDGGKPRVCVGPGSDISMLPYLRYRVGGDLTVDSVTADQLESFLALAADSGSDYQGRTSTPTAARDKSSGPIVESINRIISESLNQQASDIHFESHESGLVIRVRVDGELIVKESRTSAEQQELVSRLKIMSGLDIAEKRRPQDGRIRFPFDGRIIDIRVSVIPTDFGEKVVLRLLDKAQLRLALDSLGFTPDQLVLFGERIKLPNGIILVTGPTGSGKTTTLYAALNALRSPRVNISTVEDPIEYHLEGINQTQVHPAINVTFASMLRALLRQDPNIILIGEIRDSETLSIAIRASLTGHLVLSSVHTNSAVATVTRLLDMGAEPYLLASSLRLIVGQRLVRKACEHCAEANHRPESIAIANRLGFELTNQARTGRGCRRCGMTGYAGRTAIYELLDISRDLANAITMRAPETELEQVARSAGYRPMIHFAAELVRAGVTTPEEVLRELAS